MKKYITLHTQRIPYVIRRHPRARTMCLAVFNDGRCVVTAPYRVPGGFIEQFIGTNAQWILDKLKYVKRLPRAISVSHRRKEYLNYKESALILARERVEYFSQIYQVEVSRITIRNQKTRWGSCSRKGSVSFNYKIARLPSHLADYVIVHELCHLRAFNHSREFWAHVAQTIPNHKELRKELKIWGTHDMHSRVR